MYQLAYDRFNGRKSVSVRSNKKAEDEIAGATTTTTRRANDLVVDTARDSTTSSKEEQAQQLRCITPEATNAIDDDIKELLKPFVKAEYLEEIDFFLGDNDGLRKAIKEYGCSLQKKENEQKYNIFSKR